MPSFQLLNKKKPAPQGDDSTLAPTSLNLPAPLVALRNMESWMLITLLSAMASTMFALGLFL
jgi:hypothetical protein